MFPNGKVTISITDEHGNDVMFKDAYITSMHESMKDLFSTIDVELMFVSKDVPLLISASNKIVTKKKTKPVEKEIELDLSDLEKMWD